MISNQDLDYYQIVFPKMGIDINIKSEAFTVFGVQIQWYGVIITIGMLLAILFGFSQMKKYGIDSDRAIDAIIGGIIGGVIGARLYYVFLEWDSYKGNLKEIINTRNGGLAIYGGIIGAVLIGGLIAKIRKLRLMPLLDIAGMGFLIGQGIGRWGNFFNHEAFGYNTDLPWGMTSGKIQEWIIENNSAMSSTADILAMDPMKPVHPCFLYESIWCLLGFAVLFLISKRRKFDGQMFLMYVGWYGIGRFFIEGMRTDSLMLGNLRVSQVLGMIAFIASVIILFIMGSKVKRMGSEYVFYRDSEESKNLIEETLNKMNKSKKSAKLNVEILEDEAKKDEESKSENS